MARIPLTLIHHWFLSELLGTLFLGLAVFGIATGITAGFTGIAAFPVPLMAGLVIGTLAMLFGPYSGAHCNPAITVAQLLFKKMDIRQAVLYIAAQIAGAFLSIVLIKQLLIGQELQTAFIVDRADSSLLLSEFVGTFILVFAVHLASYKMRVNPMVAGIMIAGAATLAIAVASLSGPAFLNPALALASGSYSPIFLVIPFLGGIMGAGIGVILGELHTDEA
jgi:aquaporin Z